MQLQQNFSLKNFNSFGIDIYANYFGCFCNITELEDLFTQQQENKINSHLILGGGSNILFTKNFDGLVLKNEIKDIELINETEKHYYVKVGAGEEWHQFVLYCISQNYAGVENLSLIPGSIGASPIQNIGAYGVELKDVFYELEAYNIREKKLISFSLIDCAFGYRQSVFKTSLKNTHIITSVTFKLNKHPIFNTSYGAIEQELEKMNVQQLSIKAISNAVINIRTSKLPNPKEIGNAGSFFKNPTITETALSELKKEFSNIPNYINTINNATNYKIAAGWLIEQSGFKGYRIGDAGCHEKQALVLVNYGNAQGYEILELSNVIINQVQNKFGILLEREVNIL